VISLKLNEYANIGIFYTVESKQKLFWINQLKNP